MRQCVAHLVSRLDEIDALIDSRGVDEMTDVEKDDLGREIRSVERSCGGWGGVGWHGPYETVERVAYEEALGRLTGLELGDDVSAWQSWWHENEARLLEERALRHERRHERKAEAD